MNRTLTLCCTLLFLFFSTTKAQNVTTVGFPKKICSSGPGVTIRVNPAGSNMQWFLNGTAIPGATGQTHTATSVGRYVIKFNGVPKDSIDLVASNVSANFNIPAGAPFCATAVYNFTNTSVGSGNTYSWSFTDGSPAITTTNASHIFTTTPGAGTQSFNVALTATDDSGCSDTKTIAVIVKQKPEADLNSIAYGTFRGVKFFKKCNGTNDAYELFNNSNSVGIITNYTINWKDGSPNFTASNFPASVSHTFPSTYRFFEMYVTGANGCIDTTEFGIFSGSNPSIGYANPGNTNICAGQQINFPISNTSSHTTGTFYTTKFSDGTADSTFAYPPPTSIPHIFTATSCGASSIPGYPNSFDATIKAENPCGSSSVNVVPIYVSSGLVPVISVSPKDTICISKQMTVSDITQGNFDNDNGNCNPGKRYWTITPSTGFTVSGTLGSNNNNPSAPSIWADGSINLSLNFTTPGTYTIKLFIGNQTCGSASATKTICVNPDPTSSITTVATTGCVPFNLPLQGSANTPNCPTNQYQWNSSFTPLSGCAPGTSGVAITNPIALNTSANITSPGTYSITLSVKNSGGLCEAISTPKVVTVSDKPNVNLGSISAVCAGQTISPTASATCDVASATYAWTFSNGSPAAASTLNPGLVSFPAGSQTITVKATNTCGTTTQSATINVAPLPTLTVPSNITVCAGQSVPALTFTATPASTTISWSASTNIGAGWSGSGSIATFIATSSLSTPITSTITVTASGSGCSETKTFTITVNPAPSMPSASNPSYCVGETAVPLTATAATGNTLEWFANAAGGAPLATAPTPSTAAPGTTNYYVSQTNGTGCPSPRRQITVTVNPGATISAVGTNPTSCGATNGSIKITITGGTQSSYVVHYIKDGTANTTTIFASGGTVTITNLSAGTYSDIYIIQTNCQSNHVPSIVLSSPSAPSAPVVASVAPLCEGSTLNLSITSPNASYTYNWSGPSGYTATGASITRSNALPTMSGTYNVTATQAGCVSAAGTEAVSINPVPQTSNVNDQIVCQGATVSINPIPTQPTATWQWAGPNGFAATNDTIQFTNIQTIQSGAYTLTGTLGTCTKTYPLNITVNPTPTITVVGANPSTCGGADGSIKINIANPGVGTFTVRYTKNGTVQPAITLTAVGGSIVIPNLSAGSYTDITVTINNCPSSPAVVNLSDPSTPVTPIPSSNGPICSGKNLQLNVSNPLPGATYQWSGPNGFSAMGSVVSIPNATVAATGNYSVTVSENGCTSGPGNVAVTVKETPTGLGIIANAPLCQGANLQLQANVATAGAILNWSGPQNYSASGASATVANAQPNNSGVYWLVASLNGCKDSIQQNLVIYPVPVIAATPIHPTTCAGIDGQIMIIVANPNNGLFDISFDKNNIPQPVISQTAASGILTITGLSAGVYSNIVVKQNNCGSNAATATLIDPNPPPKPSVSYDGPKCSGSTITLGAATLPGVANAVFSWTGPNGFTSNLSQFSLPNASAIDAGTYSVNVTINNCISADTTLQVVVYAIPALPVSASPNGYCVNTVAQPLLANPFSVNYQLNWYNAASGGVATPIAPTPPTNVVTTLIYWVSQTSPEGCEGARLPIDVVIYPDSKALFTTLSDSVCAPILIDDAFVQTQTFVQNNSYNWYVNNTYLNNTPAFGGYAFNTWNDSIEIKLVTTSLQGCKPDSLTKKIFSRPEPVANFSLDLYQGCGPLTVSTTNTSAIGSFDYNWDFGNNTTGYGFNQAPVTYLPNSTFGDTTYKIMLVVSNVCKADSAVQNVVVNSKPKAQFTPMNVFGCSPMQAVFTNTSLGIGNAYEWQMGDGTTQYTTGLANVSNTYYTGVADTVDITLIATNQCGADTSVRNIIVSPNNIQLNFAMNATEVTGCAPHTVTFYNNTTGANNFVWNFDDGIVQTTNNTANVVHTFTLPGTYNVSVKAINSCTDTTAFRQIKVNSTPSAAFNMVPQICVGQNVSFNNSSVGANVFHWDFGDGSISGIESPAHSFANPGVYYVTLTSTSTNAAGINCSTQKVDSIKVVAQLQGSVQHTALSATCAPHTVIFINNTASAASVVWDFGDGTTAVGDTVSHTFSESGTYQVVATATELGGCKYITNHTVVVGGPKGVLNYTGGYLCEGNALQLQATATGATQYIWNFGDGTTQTTTTPTVSHTYANEGVYLPSVTLSNGQCQLQLNGIDSVKFDKLHIGFTSTSDQACAFTNVTFSDTSHAYYGIANIDWEFGDGSIASGTPITHAYQIGNTYPVTLNITGNSGCTKSIIKPVAVAVLPLPDATITLPGLVCTNVEQVFSSANAAALHHWQLSNGALSTEPTFVYTFANAQQYTLTHIAGNNNSCFDTATIQINVAASPNVQASASTRICFGASTQLNVSGNATGYQWNPLQGLSCTACSQPIASPTVTTPYIVVGTNAAGCATADTVVVEVVPKLEMQTAFGKDSICIGTSRELYASGAYSYAWQPAATLSQASLPNPVATPTSTTTYQVIGTDAHNCFKDTAYVTLYVGDIPTVSLGPDKTLTTGTLLPLATTITNGPVSEWEWWPTQDLSCIGCPLPIATIKNDVSYSVKITTAYGCVASDTMNIKTICNNDQLYIPNAFSPDGDGINDVYFLKGVGVGTVKKLIIFNRWGEVVFERSNISPNNPSQGWDGRVRGKMANPDVYVYMVEVICDNGTKYQYKGNITLIN